MKYDAVILGDVDPHALGNEQQERLSDLVSTAGAGLIFIAGKNFMPDSYRGTPLESLLPIEFEGSSATDEPAPQAVPLHLTPAGETSPLMRLADEQEDNEGIWKNLPGIYWDAQVGSAKPAAEVMLTDPSPGKETRSGAMPVLASQNYGRGETLFVGTDETWRWRRNVGEKYYTRFWGQVLIHFGLPRLLGASRLTQLTTDRKDYASGDRVTISGRLYRDGFEPVLDPTVEGTLTIKADAGISPTGADLTKEVTLQALPGKPGEYEAETVVTTPGIYTFSTTRDPSAALNFRVSVPRLEFGETALNVALLQKMAATSGGAFYREEDVYKMLEPARISSGPDLSSNRDNVPDGLGRASDAIPSPQEVELAFSPLYFALMILVATAEWILRKRWRLK